MSNTVQACLVLACGFAVDTLSLPSWFSAVLICFIGIATMRLLQKGW